jgi:hypothetical protein
MEDELELDFDELDEMDDQQQTGGSQTGTSTRK